MGRRTRHPARVSSARVGSVASGWAIEAAIGSTELRVTREYALPRC